MWQKIKEAAIQNVHPVDVFFVGMWLFGWFHNAEQAVKYDLDKLKDLYIWMRGYITATHGINSGLNTPIPGVQKAYSGREDTITSGS